MVYLEEVRKHYPILSDSLHSPSLVYLDSAATALKPECVIGAVVDLLSNKTANIHRSVHRLGDLATQAYEDSRQRVAEFIGALSHEIVFLRNTTEGLNLVARGWPTGRRMLVSLNEHHSNILPWRQNVTRMPPQKDGSLDLDRLKLELGKGDVGIVSVSHVSNVLGVKNDVASIAQLCHDNGAILVVDAAQSAPHEAIDVVTLDCDFLVFSGHKLGAPTGVGVLYGKAELLDKIEWHLHGGSTIEQVHSDRLIPKDIPWRFEAGTPAVESVVGLSAAISFLQSIGMDRIQSHTKELTKYAISQIERCLPSVSIVGPKSGERFSLVSIFQRVVSPHVLARGLSDRYGVCVRSGFHCAQPLHEFMGIPASLRLSFYLYNTTQDVDIAIDGIKRLMSLGG